MTEKKKNILESNGVKFTPTTFGELQVMMPNLNYQIKQTNPNSKYIDSVTYENATIEIGDSFEVLTKNSKLINYKVNYISIDKSNSKRIFLLESVINTTTMFIVPLIFNNMIESSIIHL